MGIRVHIKMHGDRFALEYAHARGGLATVFLKQEVTRTQAEMAAHQLRKLGQGEADTQRVRSVLAGFIE
jgi:hypothetical protein